MRNISKLAASMMLLATQVHNPFLGLVTAAAEADSQNHGVYEVKINTKTAVPFEIVTAKKPNFEADVLTPLHAAQAEAARKAAEMAEAAAKSKAEAEKQAKMQQEKAEAAARVAVLPVGSHADWMREAGIAESDFGYVEYIIGQESGWVPTKSNYAGSGAYGLGQALPASKMAAFGDDYQTNPVTQLKWADAYATSRFGSWANAYAYWMSRHCW